MLLTRDPRVTAVKTGESTQENVSGVYTSIGKSKRPDGAQLGDTQQGGGSAVEQRVFKEPRIGEDQKTR
jgi:hypothetical protein